MPYDIKETTIRDIKPVQPGGIINANTGDVNFKNNFVSNITSSSYGACFYLVNCKIKIENCCFLRCASSGGNEKFGNVGNIQSSNAKIIDISSFQCSYSTSQCGDSLFYFLSCGASISQYNSSFCYGILGAAAFRLTTNISDFDVSFLSCASGIDWAFVDINSIISITKSSFINSSCVTCYMICSSQNALFDECYFFLMTKNKPKFSHTVTLRNCCSDEAISPYSLTIYTNTNLVSFPILKVPACKRRQICSRKRCANKQTSITFIVAIIIKTSS